MPSPENLIQRAEDFLFEDDTDHEYIQYVVYDGLAHMYKGVDWMEVHIDEMGGTTYFVYFWAEEERELLDYDDLSPNGQMTRRRLRIHLARDIEKKI